MSGPSATPDAAGRWRNRFGQFAKAQPAPPVPREEFCVAVFGEPKSPWRAKRSDAMIDAIRAALASWDESAGEHYLAVPVEIRRRTV